jgi:transcriptional regulator with XRE-family HTH domain
MSQGKLAESTGLHINYIGSVERGERNLGLENIYTLAHALNCKAKDLVSDEELQLEINPKANSQNSDARFDNLQFQVDILMDLIKELKNDAINPI